MQVTLKRRLKSLTERILFIDSCLVYDNDKSVEAIKCQILSASNSLYDLKIWKENCPLFDGLVNIHCSCSCPDNTIRKKDCKHIYWFGLKKFGIMEPEYWCEDQYDDFVLQTWILEYDSTIKGRNEMCPICLETINYSNEKTIRCRLQCNNSVHMTCWNRYYYISGKSQCVFCRNELLSSTPF